MARKKPAARPVRSPKPAHAAKPAPSLKPAPAAKPVPSPMPAPAREAPAEEIVACPRCGSTLMTFVTSKTIACAECGYIGLPEIFKSNEMWSAFRAERELARMREMKLWGQKVFRRTIPIVVLVNWATALFFFIFFALGMFGWFRYEWFQWAFLYLSVAVVAVGFGMLVRWGKERVSI